VLKSHIQHDLAVPATKVYASDQLHIISDTAQPLMHILAVTVL